MADMLKGKGRRTVVPFSWSAFVGGLMLGVTGGFLLAPVARTLIHTIQ